MKWPTKRLLNWIAAAVVLTVVAACGDQPAARVDRALSVSITGSGRGAVSSLPAGIDLASGDANATATFTSGAEVELAATAESGSAFAGWSGACSGTGSCVVTLSGDRSVTASFVVVVPDRTLSVSVAGDGTGSVVSVPAGIEVASGTESADFVAGTEVELTATATGGSTFTGWSGGCTGTGTCVVTLDADTNATATFAAPVVVGTVDLTLNASGTGDGRVTTSIDGFGLAVGETTATVEVDAGTAVTLTATAESGSVFAGWSGACSGTGSCVLTLTGDRSVTASFVAVRTLSVSVAGTGSGGVVSVPAGIDVTTGDATATAAFTSGTAVSLTATAAAGSVFSGWSGACSGTGSCVVTLSSNRSVTASFVVLRTLSVSVAGTGTGGVVSVPAGIDVTTGDATATATFTSGTAVSLTATAESGSVFAGWSGACSGTGSCVVTLSSNRSVTASFVVLRTLSVSVAGTGTGGVVSVPAGIDVTTGDATATATFTSGTEVELTATAESGSVFAGWSGACSGTGSCVVTLSANRSVTASFVVVVPDRTLSVSVAGTGSGGVVSVPAGIDVTTGDATATATFTSGTEVELTATAASGSVFAGWSGACSGTGSCVVTLSSNRTVTASFVVLRTLSVSVAGTGTGGVVSVPAGIDVGSGDATATATFASGTVVTLTATAAAGSVFSGWSGACSGTGSCVVTLSANRSVTASFVVVVPDRTLSVSIAGTGSGGVVSVPAGVDVTTGDATATATFTSGTEVELTATAASGSVFADWSGACSGSGSCVVTLSSNRSVTATFTAGVRPTIASFATTGPVASGGLVNPGVGTTLTWSTTGADTVTLVGPGLGAGVDVTATTSFDVAALGAGAEYTLVAANAFGSVEEGVVAARAVPAFGVLIAGQSNAQGVNVTAAAANAFISATSFVRMLGNDYGWKAAYEPLDDCTDQVDVVSADPYPYAGCAVIDSGVSSGVSLGNGTSAATGGTVFLVPAARGGSSASQWAPASDRYARSTLFGSAAYRAREVAREQGAPLGLVFEGVPYGALVWYQGETDSNTTSNANAFESRTRTVLDAFRAELGAPTILVQLSRRGEVAGYSEIETIARNLRYQRLRETQRRLATGARSASGTAAPNTLANTFLVVTHDLPMHPGDGRHLSAAGQVELGRRISLAIREHLLGDATVDGSGPQLVAVEKRSNTETWVRTSQPLRPPSVTTAAAYGDYFAVISGDASISISSISLLSGDSSVVRIVHASAPGPVEVRYMPPPGIITSLAADVVRSASCDDPIPGSGGLCLPMAAFGDVYSLTEDDTMRNNQFYETE